MIQFKENRSRCLHGSVFDVYIYSVTPNGTFPTMNDESNEAYFLNLLTDPVVSGMWDSWRIYLKYMPRAQLPKQWGEAACRPGLVQCVRITTFTPNHVLCVATAVNDRPVNGIAPRMLCSGLPRPARLDRPGLVQYCIHII